MFLGEQQCNVFLPCYSPRMCLVWWMRRDEEGWDGVILFLRCLSIKESEISPSLKKIWMSSSLTTHITRCDLWGCDHINYLSNQTREWISSSIKSNMRWDKLIPNIRDDSIPSLIDAQPNVSFSKALFYSTGLGHGGPQPTIFCCKLNQA
jgi:hypothetical protein